MRVILVAGARPNFMKVAPLMGALTNHGGFDCTLVHTGQHYDEALSRVFFDELGIPRPDIELSVGSGSHAEQTAQIMTKFDPVLSDLSPDLVVVVGDVNSTVACALTAVKRGIRVAHVEAGLRSFDRAMPEEINRLVTDAISDLLFVSEPSGMANLVAEGVPAGRCHFVGNVMIDTLLRHRERARERRAPGRFGVSPGGYAILTLHRPRNVDRPSVLAGILEAVCELSRELPVIFPVHPRTRKAIRSGGLEDRLALAPALRSVEPLGYLDFLGLMADAMAVLTDSGGIQEETTVLGVPCLTLRENTERPVTIEQGTNRLVGADPDRILAGCREILRCESSSGRIPDLWDGMAADRVVRILASWEVG